MPKSSTTPNQHLDSQARTFSKINDELQQWLHLTPFGREILRKERRFFSHNVSHLFGNYSLQIGLAQINLLQGNKIVNHYTLDKDINVDLYFLPFAENSIDLIICPHVLEFHNNYEHILRELHRVLAPNGKIILSCFNRASWLGLCKKKIPLFKKAHLIKLDQLKTQLEELNFGIDGGKFFSYLPPFDSPRKIHAWRWLNQVGDRWFPTFGNSFTLILRKDTLTITPVRKFDFDKVQSFEPVLGSAKICHKN